METNYSEMWRKIGTALCLFLMLGFVACDDDDDDVAVFDNNRFFSDVSSAVIFEDWDLNDDTFLDENEFVTSYYGIWDLDNDGIFEESEWNIVAADYRLNVADWDAWDLNNDGIVDMTEFEPGFSTFNYYDTWDVDNDGWIIEREYTDGVFDIWDFDNDGILREVDYNTWYNRYYVI